MIISRKIAARTDKEDFRVTVKDAISRSAVLFPSDTSVEKACLFLSELESRISTELFGVKVWL